jgi:hypothetical protein
MNRPGRGASKVGAAPAGIDLPLALLADDRDWSIASLAGTATPH